MNISSLLSSSQMQRPDAASMREKLFKTGDTDSNGTLSKSELSTALQSSRPPGPPPGGIQGSSGTSEAPSVDDIFTQMDTDSSGEVSQDEMKAFDDAREASMQSSRSTEFSGSTDFLQSLLDKLGITAEDVTSAAASASSSSTSSTSSDSSSTASSVSTTSSTDTSTSSSVSTESLRDQMISMLVKKLQEGESTYSANGNPPPRQGGTGFFGKVV